jgi:hypothetical protein
VTASEQELTPCPACDARVLPAPLRKGDAMTPIGTPRLGRTLPRLRRVAVVRRRAMARRRAQLTMCRRLSLDLRVRYAAEHERFEAAHQWIGS